MNKEKLWILCENLADVEHQIEDMALQLQRLSDQLANIKRGIAETLSDDSRGSIVEIEKPRCKIPKAAKAPKAPKGTAQKPKIPATEYQMPELPITDIVSEVIPESAPMEISAPQSPDIPIAEDEATPIDQQPAVDLSHTMDTPSIEDITPIISKPKVPKCNIPVPKGEPIEVRYSPVIIYNEFEFSDTEYSKSNRSIYVIEVMTESLARFYPIADQAKRLISKRAELLDPICIADTDLNIDDFIISEDDYGIMTKNDYDRWNILKQCSLIH